MMPLFKPNGALSCSAYWVDSGKIFDGALAAWCYTCSISYMQSLFCLSVFMLSQTGLPGCYACSISYMMKYRICYASHCAKHVAYATFHKWNPLYDQLTKRFTKIPDFDRRWPCSAYQLFGLVCMKMCLLCLFLPKVQTGNNKRSQSLCLYFCFTKVQKYKHKLCISSWCSRIRFCFAKSWHTVY